LRISRMWRDVVVD